MSLDVHARLGDARPIVRQIVGALLSLSDEQQALIEGPTDHGSVEISWSRETMSISPRLRITHQRRAMR